MNAIVPYKSKGLPQHGPKHNRNNVLIHFEAEEEDRERDAVKLVVQKYVQLFKYLFDKYTSHQKRQPSDFMSEKTIRIMEVIKLFRDHNIDHAMLTKHETQVLIQ